MLKFIADNAHYSEVLALVPKVNRSLWIGTADIKESGLERSYEKELRGVKGLKVVVVDVHNREVGRYNDGQLDRDPIAGKDIYLGMDADLQAYGEKLMVGKIGSIVAIEPKTGQILAFVSSPTYDPNLLVGRERAQHYKDLQEDPMKPLINRAISGTYPPGSTFKTVVGMIAMQSGSITPATCFHCSGQASLPIKCTHSHGSSPDFANAIMNSCNPYFYESFKATINNPKFGGVKKGYEYWKEMTYKMGLGHTFGTDIWEAVQRAVFQKPLPSFQKKYYLCSGFYSNGLIVQGIERKFPKL